MEQFPLGSSRPYNLPNVASTPTNLPNQWAYSPSFSGAKLLAQASIQLTGSRRADYLAAERSTGTRHRARVTVWHHVYDFVPNIPLRSGTCTMQLVAWNDHQQTIPHAGGCKAFSAQYNRPYRLPAPDKEAPAVEIELPAYSAKELEEFSLRTGLTLSPELRRFYSGEFRLSQAALRYAAQKDIHLDAVLPLWDEEGASVEGMQQFLKGHSALQPLKELTCIGVDACGNVFCTDEKGGVLFYDHEEDIRIDADVDLRSLLET